MKVSITKVYEVAVTRPPGYAEDVLQAGVQKDGWLILTNEAYAALVTKYSTASPSIVDQAVSLTKALVDETKAVVTGQDSVTEEEVARRLQVCRECEHITDNMRCSKCRCYMTFKTKLRTQHCVIGKW